MNDFAFIKNAAGLPAREIAARDPAILLNMAGPLLKELTRTPGFYAMATDSMSVLGAGRTNPAAKITARPALKAKAPGFAPH